jgi:ABC-type glycerol-3-phosphate transport system permease component
MSVASGHERVDSRIGARVTPGPDRRRLRGVEPDQILAHAVLIIAAILAVSPLVWCIFASFKTFKEVMESPTLIPQHWTLASYQTVFGLSNLWIGFRNTVVVAFSVTAVSVITSTTAGFVFAKYRFWGKEALFLLLLATLMVPFAVILIPLYITVGSMGLSNHLGGVIVTGLCNTFGIFLMRQFMGSIPYEMLEAARIDGTSEWRIFIQMIIPLSASPMAALSILIFLGVWNDYLWPLVVLSSQDEQTLPLILNGLQGYYDTRYDYLIAAAIVTVIPLMAAYLFGSKYMIRGIAMTGLKF